MAGPRDYAAEYARRIERRLGMPLAEARQRGISRQRARGHGPREKAATAARQRATGQLTETDRRFLRRQEQRAAPRHRRSRRTGRFEIVETAAERFERARAVYLSQSPAQREQTRKEQASLARRYSRSGRSGGMPQPRFYDLVPDMDNAVALLFFYH